MKFFDASFILLEATKNLWCFWKANETINIFIASKRIKRHNKGSFILSKEWIKQYRFSDAFREQIKQNKFCNTFKEQTK